MARLSWSLLLCALGVGLSHASSTAAQTACKQVPLVVSNSSKVLGNPLHLVKWDNDIYHWFNSSSHTPTCVVEVGSPEDLSAVMKVIGKTRAPFSVKAGGHASNPGFSSTPGVHISLVRLNQVVLSADKSTAVVGTGQTWIDVYKKLEGSGRNVVGGRYVGPGVGGFTAGGGYSWKTNQFGLTCDTVRAYNMVLPNGTITTVTQETYPDLFFALKGGLNRFGIIISVELETHEQAPVVWTGYTIYTADAFEEVASATAEFYRTNTDPKAQLITTFEGTPVGPLVVVLFFYDGPERPAAFDGFRSISLVEISSAGSQSFSSALARFDFPAVIPRGRFDTLSTTALTPGFMAAVVNQTTYWTAHIALHGGALISYDAEPFTNYGVHATDSAYPHAGSPLPFNILMSWDTALEDAFWLNALRESVAVLTDVAKAEGIWDDSFTKYPNYAISGTTSEELYGKANAARMAAIRKEIDSEGIMELAGGFSI